VQRNLQTLGILWCVFGAYRVIAGLIGMFVLRVITLRNFEGGWPFGDQLSGSFGRAPAWTASLFPLLAIITAITAALALLVGYALLTRRPWGRTLAIVVGILTLLKPLLGTALGIYTLWVLAPSASGAEYEAIEDRSGL
jgi:ABC-type glycerol-3-phosphate transport system permease component